MGGQIWLQQPPLTQSPAIPCPGPNNKEIYDHLWSLLALFPWETTRSACTDLQECPKAWEPLLVGIDSSPLHCIGSYKAMWEYVQKRGWPVDNLTPVKGFTGSFKMQWLQMEYTWESKWVEVAGEGPRWHNVVKNICESYEQKASRLTVYPYVV